MHTILVGLSHKTAGLELREKMYFMPEAIPAALNELARNSPLHGAVIISTCNRTEIYAASEKIDEAFEKIISFIGKFHKIKPALIKPSLYKKSCEKAVAHLLEVVSSIDSMVVGEDQILGQVKEAYFIAKKTGTTEQILNKLFQTAIQTGKKVRSETDISKGAVSVGSVAVGMLKNKNNGIKKEVLLIGAGKISEVTAANLRKNINCNITVSNRTLKSAKDLAGRVNAAVVPFGNRYEQIKKSDIIIVSTCAKDYVIKYSEISKSLKTILPEKVFIDLSVPRNIDPAISEYGCELFTIDDMQEIIKKNIRKRSNEIKNARGIIDEIAEEYFNWYAKQTVIPVMKDIKGRFDLMGHVLLQKHKKELSNLTGKQKEVLELILQEYSKKIIRTIMKNMRNITTTDDLGVISHRLKRSFIIDND